MRCFMASGVGPASHRRGGPPVHRSGGRGQRVRVVALRLLPAATGADELDATNRGVLRALRSVVGPPLAVDEATAERYRAPHRQVLRACLGLLVEGGDVEVQRPVFAE